MTRNERYLNSLFDNQLGAVNYLINISESLQVVYIEQPKVACSTIKKTLQYIDSLLTGRTIPEDVHKKIESPLKSPLDYSEHLEKLFKKSFTFTYVRNPFSRILSCYIDKIIGSTWERKIRLPKLGVDPSRDLSLVEFLRLVKKQSLQQMDIHWYPQFSTIGAGRFEIDYIGKFEQFQISFPKVVKYICQKTLAINYSESHIKTHNWHLTGSDRKIFNYYDKESIDLVLEIYEEDFDSFGYSKILELA